jgi:hypothetical protein
MSSRLKFIVSVVLITISIQLNAQKLGVRMGWNFSNQSFGGPESMVYAESSGTRTGTTYGGYLNFKLIPLVSLQVEANYEPKGIDFNEPPILNALFEGEYHRHYNYLVFPLMLKLSLLSVHFEAGPYLGLLMDATELRRGTLRLPLPDGAWDIQILDEQKNLKPYTQKTDFGWVVGTGFTMNLHIVQFTAGIRYSRGSYNILRPDGSDAEAFNRSFTVFAGAGIQL